MSVQVRPIQRLCLARGTETEFRYWIFTRQNIQSCVYTYHWAESTDSPLSSAARPEALTYYIHTLCRFKRRDSAHGIMLGMCKHVTERSLQ